jgi:hypothetical protein
VRAPVIFSVGRGGFCTVFSPEAIKYMSFGATLKSFCEELRLTFPELRTPIDRVATTITPELYWANWKTGTRILLHRDDSALFEARRGFLVGPLQLTPALWHELSESTQRAIWRYLRTLLLEAVMVLTDTKIAEDTTQDLITILSQERLEAGGAEADAEASELFEQAMPQLAPLMEKLKGMLGSFVDLSGVELPKLPEHLAKGKIAKLAEELSKQIRPEEFGIDPAMLEGETVEAVLKRLAELYERDPTVMTNAAKRMAEKIQKQILGGSLNREELLAEAREYVEVFKEHPSFKGVIEKLQALSQGADGLGALFGSSGGAPSERLRATQDRLRKKLAARKATR